MDSQLHISYILMVYWTNCVRHIFSRAIGGCWNNQIILWCKFGPNWAGILSYMYCVWYILHGVLCMEHVLEACNMLISLYSLLKLYSNIWWLEYEHKFSSCILFQPSKFEFYDPKTPFFTAPRNLPPTQLDKCKVQILWNTIITSE